MNTKNVRKKGSRATKKTKEGAFLENWLRQKLRRISYQFPPRKEAIKKARISRGKYKCAICGGENFGPKDIQLDHIIPVINPHEGFQDWNQYIERLFVDVTGWQVCCRQCHKYKTEMENEVRKQVKRDKIKEEDDL